MWEVCNFRDYSVSAICSQGLVGGSYVRLFHKEVEGFMTVDPHHFTPAPR